MDKLLKFEVWICTLRVLTMEGKERCRNYVRMFVKGFDDFLIVDVIEHKVQKKSTCSMGLAGFRSMKLDETLRYLVVILHQETFYR